MIARICDCCNRTIPEGSKFFKHEYKQAEVGSMVYGDIDYYDICSICHDRILNYILNDDFRENGIEIKLERVKEEGNGQDSTQDS